ncbi:MAG: hypothetical protein WA188_11795 [Terriglobales bacterium]
MKMATGPRIHGSPSPIQRTFRVDGNTHVPWVAIFLIVATVTAALLIVTLPRAPKAEAPPEGPQVPPQPTGKQIQLSAVKGISEPHGAFYLTGQLTNNGKTNVNGILVEIEFRDQAGKSLRKQTVPAEDIGPESGPTPEHYGFQPPIKPRETRAFGIRVTEVPAGWNREIPKIKIVAVTASRG